jgi:hypothetical protein
MNDDSRQQLQQTAAPQPVPGEGWVKHPREHIAGRCECFVLIPTSSTDETRRREEGAEADKSLVAALEAHFQADSALDEYAILHPSALEGADFLRPEPGKLAISSACTEALFREARREIKAGGANMLPATRALLLLSGDDMTAWNIRKRQAKESSPSDLSLLLAEVHLTTLVFSARAKAGNAWAHRRWACKLFASSSVRNEDFSMAFWQKELSVCEDVAIKHPRNYYAWTHRMWVCRQLAELKRGGAALAHELAWANGIFRQNVSDRSIAHHCEQVLLLYVEQASSSDASSRVAAGQAKFSGGYAALVRQLSFGLELAHTLPGHESLWQHLRATMRAFLAVTFNRSDAAAAREAFDIACSELDNERTELETGEASDYSRQTSASSSWWEIVICHMCMCARTMRGPVPWSADAQRRCAVSYACDIALCLVNHLKEHGTKASPTFHEEENDDGGGGGDDDDDDDEANLLHARLVATGCTLSFRQLNKAGTRGHCTNPNNEGDPNSAYGTGMVDRSKMWKALHALFMEHSQAPGTSFLG